MSYRIYFAILLSLVLTISYAQEVVLSSDEHPEMRYLGISGKIFFNEYQQIRGSGYLSDDWTLGDIIFNNGTVVKNINLKIDIYAHQVLMYHDLLKRILILEKKDINTVVLHENGVDRKFKRLDIDRLKSYSADGIFVEVLTEGKVTFSKLFFKERIFLSSPVKPYIYEFLNGKEYRISYNSRNTAISLKKRALYKLFPENKLELKQYIRSSHLKLKKESDFSKAVSYINELKK